MADPKRWLVYLPGNHKAVVEAPDSGGAIAAYNRIKGIRNTIHDYSVAPTDLPLDARIPEETPEAVADTTAMAATIAELRRAQAAAQQQIAELQQQLAGVLRPQTPAPPAATAQPVAAHDPDLEELGLHGETAELLIEAGLDRRSKIQAAAREHGNLTYINGIGPVSDQEVRRALATYAKKE
jgi:hypothetical protein